MKRGRLKELMDQFQRIRIAVAGDLFLDRWMTIDPKLNEPSVETGLPAWQVIGERRAAGAAGTVLNNFSALGIGKLYAVSLLGMDGAGWEVENALKGRGVDVSLLVKSSLIATPQYIKPLFIQKTGPAREGNRLDVKNWKPTPQSLEERLAYNLEVAAKKVDAVVILDQLDRENTGVATSSFRDRVHSLARKLPSLLLYADSWSFIHCYRDVIIKCNDKEAARMATGREPEGAFSKAGVFGSMDKLQALTGKPVFVTCNAHGVAAQGPNGKVLVPAARQNGPIDVCGAGDGCTAGIVSALCAGADPVEAAFLGNLTAGVTVRKLGDTGTASQEEVWRLYEEQFEGNEA